METIGDLEQAITRILEQGIMVSEKTLFFAESTYGITDETLVPALCDPSFEGKEPLEDLIFTPDLDVRISLEPLVSNQGVVEGQIEDLAAILSEKFRTIDLVLPGGSARFSVETDRDTILFFLKKLYFDRSIENSIANTLNESFSTTTTVSARVLMRCRGNVFGEIKRGFLCRFIKLCTSHENRFEDLWCLVLTLLAEIDDEQPVEPYFSKKKRALINTLKDIRIFAKKQEHYSMEYLMMQRFRVPPESEEEVLKQLYLLTTITDVILGMPPDSAVSIESRDLGSFDMAGDIQHLIKTLS